MWRDDEDFACYITKFCYYVVTPRTIFSQKANVNSTILSTYFFGMLHSLSFLGLLINYLTKKTFWLKSLIQSLYRTKFLTWTLFLTVELGIYLYMLIVRCNPSFDFSKATTLKDPTNAKDLTFKRHYTELEILTSSMMCAEDTLFSNNFKSISGLIFTILSIINYYFYLGINSYIKPRENPLIIRKNYTPELQTIIMFALLMFVQN